MNRSQEREQAFIVLFEQAFHPELSETELIELAEESEIIKKSEFTESLIHKTNENLALIDTEISTYAVGWSLERMNRVTLSVLRLAVCEILYFDDIPDSVSINEAVELAKKYAGEKDSAFINGILGSVTRGNEN